MLLAIPGVGTSDVDVFLSVLVSGYYWMAAENRAGTAQADMKMF